MAKTSLARTEKVDAVNRVLATIGVGPLSTLTGNLSLTATLAQAAVDNVSKDLQSTPWGFNTERNVEFTSTSDGEIDLDGSGYAGVAIASIDFDGGNHTDFDVIIRTDAADSDKPKLYDRKEHKFNGFGNAQVYKATVTYLLEFDDLPEAVKAFVMARAAREFQMQMVGNAQVDAMLFTQVVSAQQNLHEFEANQFDYTIFDNYDVFRTVNRVDRPFSAGFTSFNTAD
jgi:hypothetical protein|tara:strand:+ start:86 stop:769 length:684 start_codon:yes stop_codon:yes gene_type:complete